MAETMAERIKRLQKLAISKEREAEVDKMGDVIRGVARDSAALNDRARKRALEQEESDAQWRKGRR